MVFLSVTLGGVASCSLYALATLVFDGFIAAAILLPATLAGLWLVPRLRLGDLPVRWRLLLGAALGIGVLCVSVLVLGCVGVLSRWLWIGILSAMCLAGVVKAGSRLAAKRGQAIPWGRHDALHWLWLALAPLLVLGILTAVHAPGFLWTEEGWGYDALEYHLQLPKEYHAAGRISYTPHNVYGNFPANVEMLYLLGMVLTGEEMEAGTTAHMIHLSLAVLTVCAAYVGGREWSRRGGIIAAVAMGSAGWLVYLSGLAYVENGLLFFGTVAMAAALRALRPTDDKPTNENEPSPSRRCGRWFVVAGLCAGFACGCKYTAVPMIALPLALTGLFARDHLMKRIRYVAMAGIAAIVAFSPWAVKNLAMTGNPVFPLANSIFHATPKGWGLEESAHWDRCHSADSERQAGHELPGEDDHYVSRFSYLIGNIWNRILHDRYGRFGPLLFVLAAVGLFTGRKERRTCVLVLVLGVQVFVWLFATHLYARFAVVMLIPLALLTGRCVLAATSSTKTVALTGLILAGVGVNFAAMRNLYHTEAMPGAIAPASLIYEGKLPGYEYLATINDALPDDAYVLVLGDAKGFYYDRRIDYCVVFNRNPFVEAVKKDPQPMSVAAWLHDRGYSHLLVDWSEIHRLRSSAYGFPSEMTDHLFNALEASGSIRRMPLDDTKQTETAKRLYEVRP